MINIHEIFFIYFLFSLTLISIFLSFHCKIIQALNIQMMQNYVKTLVSIPPKYPLLFNAHVFK